MLLLSWSPSIRVGCTYVSLCKLFATLTVEFEQERRQTSSFQFIADTGMKISRKTSTEKKVQTL